MPKLADMTKAEWKRIKANADIKKSKWFSTGHASVGRHIDALVKARQAFEGEQSQTNILKYFSKLLSLKKALDKFKTNNKKELAETKARPLKTDIEAWIREIDTNSSALAMLAKNFDALVGKASKSALNQRLSKCGLPTL